MANNVSFKTDRLHVQSWDASLSAAQPLAQLVKELATILTPGVLRHLPEPLQLADHPNAVDLWITERAEESAVMAIRHADDSTLLGLLILAEFPAPCGPDTAHIGYLLSEDTWGKGYATELLAGLITWYKCQQRSIQLLGGVEKGNPASARVLEKNGFQRTKVFSDDTTDMFSLKI